MFALEFIEIFWPSFIPSYSEHGIGKFFVSTCLNCNCYLTEAVHCSLEAAWLVSDVLVEMKTHVHYCRNLTGTDKKKSSHQSTFS